MLTTTPRCNRNTAHDRVTGARVPGGVHSDDRRAGRAVQEAQAEGRDDDGVAGEGRGRRAGDAPAAQRGCVVIGSYGHAQRWGLGSLPMYMLSFLRCRGPCLRAGQTPFPWLHAQCWCLTTSTESKCSRCAHHVVAILQEMSHPRAHHEVHTHFKGDVLSDPQRAAMSPRFALSRSMHAGRQRHHVRRQHKRGDRGGDAGRRPHHACPQARRPDRHLPAQPPMGATWVTCVIKALCP